MHWFRGSNVYRYVQKSMGKSDSSTCSKVLTPEFKTVDKNELLMTVLKLPKECLENAWESLGLNVFTTPLLQWGFRQCLPFSWTTLRGKHCKHPIAVKRVVDTFRSCFKTCRTCLALPSSLFVWSRVQAHRACTEISIFSLQPHRYAHVR